MNNTADQNTQNKESELVQQAISGSADAFGQLYDQYVEKIYSYLYYRTRHRREAEDLCSRVFMKALNHIENYEDRGYPFSAWLYRIAHNLVVNWYRDMEKKREIPLVDQYPPPAEDSKVESRMVEFDQNKRLMSIIKQMPADRQELIILKHVEGLSNKEIGQIMDRTEGAIKALYHRTLTALREEYDLG